MPLHLRQAHSQAYTTLAPACGAGLVSELRLHVAPRSSTGLPVIADSLTLRELGAATRTFRTVKGAMLWYVAQLAARLRVNRDMEWGSTPRCEEARQMTNATFAKLATCLKGQPGEQVLYLVAWYETTWGDGQFLADQAGLSRWAFTRRCRKTERVLQGRMEEAGLLEMED